MKYKAIGFDLDGTLLSTMKDIAYSLNIVLKNHNYKTLSYNTIKKLVGNGLKELFKNYEIDPSLMNNLISEFTSIYSKYMTRKTKPFTHTYETLKYLKDKGYILFVISNKIDTQTKELINYFFNDIFDIVLGASDTHIRKPDPCMLNIVKDKYELDNKDILYIGDSITDYEFSKLNNLDCYIFKSGYGNRKKLKDLDKSIRIKNIKCLKKVL